MVIKSVALVVWVIVPYGMILSNHVGPALMLVLAVIMGAGVAGIGFGISHDALHGAYSHRPWLNSLLGFSFDALGASSYLWKITHNTSTTRTRTFTG
jgi:linoleoyl-CoA desaturase